MGGKNLLSSLSWLSGLVFPQILHLKVISFGLSEFDCSFSGGIAVVISTFFTPLRNAISHSCYSFLVSDSVLLTALVPVAFI